MYLICVYVFLNKNFYRKTIPEEEQKEIFAEVYSELHEFEVIRKKLKRKKVFIKPKTL